MKAKKVKKKFGFIPLLYSADPNWYLHFLFYFYLLFVRLEKKICICSFALFFARTGKNWAPRCQVKKKKRRRRRKSRKKVSSMQGDRVHSLRFFQLEFSCFLFSCTQAAVCSSKSSVCQCLSTVPDIHWISVLRLTVSRLCWLWFCLCVGATLPVVPILKKILFCEN